MVGRAQYLVNFFLKGLNRADAFVQRGSLAPVKQSLLLSDSLIFQ